MARDLRSSWARGEAWAPARDWRRLRVSPAVGAAAGTPRPGFPRAPPPCPRRRGLPCHRHPQSVSCDRRCRERGVARATSLRARGAHAPRPSACVGGTSAARPSGMRPEGRPWGGGEDGVRSQPGPPVSPDDRPSALTTSLRDPGRPRPSLQEATVPCAPLRASAPSGCLRCRPLPSGTFVAARSPQAAREEEAEWASAGHAGGSASARPSCGVFGAVPSGAHLHR